VKPRGKTPPTEHGYKDVSYRRRGLAVTLGGADHPHRAWPFGGRVVLIVGIVLLVLWLFERDRDPS
jgi:hypothetical protein